MAIVAKTTNYIYSGVASANTNYQTCTINRTVVTDSLSTTSSSNFLYIDVAYKDSTINGTLRAILLVSLASIISPGPEIVPQGISNDYEFPISTTPETELYQHLQVPDSGNYTNFFMVFFQFDVDYNIIVSVNTPNYAGELLVTVKHMAY